MRSFVFGIVVATTTGFGLACPGPKEVPLNSLSAIRGNTACAVAMPTTGGCTECVRAGSYNLTYSYYMGSTLYTTTMAMPAYAKCTAPSRDEMCMTASTFLSNCNKNNAPCPAGATMFTNAVCTALMPVQPTTGPTCAPTYVSATVTPDTGLTCGNVVFGMY